jgi:hypothetical protein
MLNDDQFDQLSRKSITSQHWSIIPDPYLLIFSLKKREHLTQHLLVCLSTLVLGGSSSMLGFEVSGSEI